MYFDGSLDVHRYRISAVFSSTLGTHFPVATILKFPCTNIILENEECITSLKAALDMSMKVIEVYEDSILVIS